jgi:molybdenum cofactor cytidylyltransferase
MIAGLLLAAGRSTRFGADKLTAQIDGSAVIALSVRAIAALDDVIVVTGPEHETLANALDKLAARLVVNAEFASGMASSIRVGVDALSIETDAVVIALGDQPFVSQSVTDALVERWKAGGADVVAPEYTDGRGHPVLFGRTCFAALRALRGDAGARSLIESGQFRVARVRLDRTMPIDVDTPAALALAMRRATDEASMSPPND